MFDYLGVLLSVILGLALTHILLGWSRLIQTRRTVRPYWVQLVWSLNILLYVLALWWGMYWWRQLADWTFQEFVFLTGYAIVLFVLASVLVPPESRDVTDFEAFFFSNRRWFFGLLLIAQLVDIPETLAKQTAHLRAVPVEYAIYIPAVIVMSAIGIFTANRRVHAGLAIGWLFAFLAYLTLTSLARIVAR